MKEKDMKPGDRVTWKWGNGLAKGRVVSVHIEPTMLSSKGKNIRRTGTKNNPAIIIEHKSGGDVLKLMSEVEKSS